jgi:hypothetical protein
MALAALDLLAGGHSLAIPGALELGNHVELRPELVALVRQLRRKRPKGGQKSLRDISAELAARGHLNERRKPYSAASINSMLHP